MAGHNETSEYSLYTLFSLFDARLQTLFTLKWWSLDDRSVKIFLQNIFPKYGDLDLLTRLLVKYALRKKNDQFKL